MGDLHKENLHHECWNEWSEVCFGVLEANTCDFAKSGIFYSFKTELILEARC